MRVPTSHDKHTHDLASLRHNRRVYRHSVIREVFRDVGLAYLRGDMLTIKGKSLMLLADAFLRLSRYGALTDRFGRYARPLLHLVGGLRHLGLEA